jgi:hypothetical protein
MNNTEDFLAHYGKKGMKWGVRMNPDGSYSNLKKAQKNYDKAYDKHGEQNKDRILKQTNAKTDKFLAEFNKKWAHVYAPGVYISRETAMVYNKELMQGLYDIQYSQIKKEIGDRPGGAIIYHSDDLEDFLAHYGVRGMKWGRRNARSSENLATGLLRKKPASSLSDAELKQAISRMNLEKQYRDLNPRGLSKANKVVLGIVALGTTVNSVINFKNSPFGQTIVKSVKQSFEVVKNK